MDKNTMVVAVAGIIAVAVAMSVILITLTKPMSAPAYTSPEKKTTLRDTTTNKGAHNIICPTSSDMITDPLYDVDTRTNMRYIGEAAFNGKQVCSLTLEGGVLSDCGLMTIYFDEGTTTFNKAIGCESSVKSYDCIVACNKVLDWRVRFFPPAKIAPGSSGFGSVRPQGWSCIASTGVVQAQWANGAGQKIQVTPPANGCTYEGSTYTRPFDVSANGRFTCNHGVTSGCAGLNVGDRFESTVILSWEPSAGGLSHTESGSVWKAAE